MTPAEKPAFIAALVQLASFKPGAKLTQEQYAAWWDLYRESEWTLTEFRQACHHFAHSVEWMPNPYHFTQLRKAIEPSPVEAWAQVRDAVRRMRPGEAVTISPRIDRVVRAMGGYRALGMTSSDEMHFREKDFARMWDELGTADDARDALPLLGAEADRRQVDGPQRLFAGSKAVAS